MFTYSPDIDTWSKEMIKGMDAAWGHTLPKPAEKSTLVATEYLLHYLNDYAARHLGTIVERFNTLTGVVFDAGDIRGYVNTAGVSMHNGKEKYVSIALTHPFIAYPTVLIHEIFHIYFAHYVYSARFLTTHNITRPDELISPHEENEIKEIVTVILNELFTDIIDSPDEGYPKHQAMRARLSEYWKNDKPSFDEWVTRAIEMYKK